MGRDVHEDPMIPNYDSGKKLQAMEPGLILAIEPMIIQGGDYKVKIADNQWDVNSADNSLTAHFEHTVAVTDEGCLVITE